MCVCALPAFAHRSHGHFRGSLWIGPAWTPWWGPYASPYPYIYDNPAVVIEREPYLYETPEPQEEPPYYWYYCKEPKGYYPYVQRCPIGWTKVKTSPPEEKE
ncbi:MAG: hypothetical protein HZB33_13145 [Nitrospirae bacterium]|nr:hypothetical protein [Nitrospirota bacterium]